MFKKIMNDFGLKNVVGRRGVKAYLERKSIYIYTFFIGWKACLSVYLEVSLEHKVHINYSLVHTSWYL